MRYKDAIWILELIRNRDARTEAEKDAVNAAIEALKAQLSQEGTTSALNNQVNLCDSCTYTYPECQSEKDDVIFGNGIGNDNICACNKYQPTVQPVATDTNVGDTISRQAAIDALDCINGVEEVLRSLPPVQPESCEGCIQCGLWENEIENGYPSPCTRCKRRANDNYER